MEVGCANNDLANGMDLAASETACAKDPSDDALAKAVLECLYGTSGPCASVCNAADDAGTD
jgi:hypothetical protein